MKVVRAREERDYRADGNRVSTHRLKFGLTFDSPRGSKGKLTGSVDVRRSNKEFTVGDIRLAIPSTAGTNDISVELSMSHRMSLDELIEFATGLKAAAIMAQDLFKAKPPVQAQPRPCACAGGGTAREEPGRDAGDIGSVGVDKAAE